MYEERPSRLAGAVVWTNTPAGAGVHPVLPDGCMDLLWNQGRLLVAGPDTHAYVPDAPPASWAGLRFYPGTAPALLGVPAHELRDQRVELADLWPAAEVRRLRARVEAAAHPATALEELALERAAPPDPELRHLVTALAAGHPVAATADELGIGARQLHRRSLTAFGYGPKTLARILRLQRALALARTGLPYADTATRAGYADQAHLARDVRELSGTTLTDLLRQRREQVDAVAVGVVHDGVPLAPGGVPGLELADVPGAHELLVHRVDLGGPVAAQGEGVPAASRRRLPAGEEGPDGLLGVQQQPQPAW
ncbi:HTH araC/xylS-type domain-containing protein OS=Streptomyces aurantiogriseus OX=66870 GN=GCM10010251_48300 PE=4 SV=1 [Streptomyces aurantiogriseus]|uniref:HTH araC/xylS-type domain-containing protein n=1 Tax=Streptomyces aurantiogriseus TaxID=66870 RepID=A0A918CI55_9ACTN|nr:hypothetical protein GCM10010251_48300 [Streptomyces aurantiogriseus]